MDNLVDLVTVLHEVGTWQMASALQYRSPDEELLTVHGPGELTRGHVRVSGGPSSQPPLQIAQPTMLWALWPDWEMRK